MQNISELFNDLLGSFSGFLPSLLGAIVLLIIGFFVAGFFRRITAKLLRKTSIDESINEKLNTSFNFERLLSLLVYYLILLFVILLVLDMLGLSGVMEPLENMLNKIVGGIPNVIFAGLVGFIGYIIARIASEAVGLISGTLEGLSEKAGLTGGVSLTKIVKQIVFLFVFIPMLVVALDYLKMKVISEPATNMLNMMMEAIPNIIVAVVILGVFYFVGKFVVGIVTELLRNLSTDQLTTKMGLGEVMGESSLSKIVGQVLFFFLMFIGIITAADKLGLGELSDILNNLLEVTGRIAFGIVILIFGKFISDKASLFIAGPDKGAVQNIARYAILIIFLAMALHAMGLAPSIVNLAFGLTLGAVAVAAALSFGLGGREAAGRQLDRWFNQWRNDH